MTTRVRGTVMQTPNQRALQILHDVVVEVDADGVIESVTAAADLAPDIVATVDVSLPDTAVLLPGVVDTHNHAPQWPQLGTGLDIPLERWLFEHTFPLEARFADVAYAISVGSHLVPTLLARGTTTADLYGSTPFEATTALAQVCADRGMRALVGRVGMDHPEGTPEWYRDADADIGISNSAASIHQIRAIGSLLVEPIVTPRFIPACTDALLSGLAELAAASDVRIQTHCSESDWEHQYVIDRTGITDTAALEQFGLLRRSTVLAHADLVSDDDLGIIGQHGAGVAHCPLSNAYFSNGVFPARRALAAGVHVGLGTDVAGGAEPGVLGQCSHAVTASRYLEVGVDSAASPELRGVADSRIDIVTAFWMATLGGAELLDLPVGLLAPGRRFDAFVVDEAVSPVTSLRRWDVDTDERWFEKVMRLATPADITDVWVDGRRVAGVG
jgi:guanine deaminase